MRKPSTWIASAIFLVTFSLTAPTYAEGVTLRCDGTGLPDFTMDVDAERGIVVMNPDRPNRVVVRAEVTGRFISFVSPYTNMSTQLDRRTGMWGAWACRRAPKEGVI